MGRCRDFLAHITELLNNVTFYAVEWINGFAGGVLIWRSPSLLWIGVYYVLLYGLLYAAKLRVEARATPQYMEDETRPLAEIGLSVNKHGGFGGTGSAQYFWMNLRLYVGAERLFYYLRLDWA